MDDIDWTAAAKYLSGDASPAERAAFEEWMHGDPERQRIVAELEPQMRRRESAVAVDVDAAWARLSRRIDSEPLSVSAAARPKPRLNRSKAGVLLVGAAAAGLAGILFIPSWIESRNEPGAVAPQLASTTTGERKAVVLRDGSRVTLAPMSSVRAFIGSEGERRVELSGEALLVVAHDESRTFVVWAGDASITDLGTTFTVRARPNENRVAVAVLEGAVELGGSAGGTRVVISAGGTGVLERGEARSGPADAARSAAWSSGQLVFSGTPLAEVAAELERWHGVRVQVAPALAGRTLSATFSGESIDQIARAIAQAVDAVSVRRGNTLTFSPR